MLTNLCINNFKLHKHTDLQIKGLTILTGVNGMGKSSVIQSLLLLRQSFLTGELDGGLNLFGDLFDAGTAEDIMCPASETDTLGISLRFNKRKPLSFHFSYPKANYFDTMLEGDPKNETSKSILSAYSLFNDKFQYLSAFRWGPQPSYKRNTSIVKARRQISKINGQCEYAIHFLDEFKNTEIPIRKLASPKTSKKEPDYRLSIQVDLWLREISPNIKISIEQASEELKLKFKYSRMDKPNTNAFSAMNTGFGITYALPILIALLSAQKDSIIIIENPEAHIHPAGQATLMKLISKAVANGVQVIIETHSDHIVNGALVSVNENLVKSEQLSIYYFERNDEEHTAIPHCLEITPQGHINKPPKGFFDQIDSDLKILLGF